MTRFYHLMPWDIDRLTVHQFNNYIAHRAEAIAAIEAANKQQGR